MEIRIIKAPISWPQVQEFAKSQFGEMVKAAVDVERGIIALGGDLHSDEEALLLEDGSKQSQIWGINLYPGKPAGERVEFDSMINIRPSDNNRSRGVEAPLVREKILAVIGWVIRS